MKVEKQQCYRITGLGEAAKKLGCSKTHLHYVITGERQSKRLREKARQLGIRLPRVAE